MSLADLELSRLVEPEGEQYEAPWVRRQNAKTWAWVRRMALWGVASLAAVMVVTLIGHQLSGRSRQFGASDVDKVESKVGVAAPAAPAAPAAAACLCIFDVDRTLTGKQGWEDECP